MAVRRLEVRSPTAAGAVASPRDVEPLSITDCGREINYSETGKCFCVLLYSFKHDFTVTPLVVCLFGLNQYAVSDHLNR